MSAKSTSGLRNEAKHGRNTRVTKIWLRRQCLVTIRHYSAIIVPISDKFITTSDFLKPLSVVAKDHGLSEPTLTQLWRRETKKIFGRPMRWPYRQLASSTFCKEYASERRDCPDCRLLSTLERLDSVRTRTDIPNIAPQSESDDDSSESWMEREAKRVKTNRKILASAFTIAPTPFQMTAQQWAAPAATSAAPMEDVVGEAAGAHDPVTGGGNITRSLSLAETYLCVPMSSFKRQTPDK